MSPAHTFKEVAPDRECPVPCQRRSS